MVYEVFLNQIGYHSLTGFSFLVYVYLARNLYDQNTKAKPFFSFLKDSFLGFLKLRFLFATVSLLSEFWGAKLALKQINGKHQISPHGVRSLLLKEAILGMLWATSVAKLAHD